jgi:hypothetical protein
MLYASRLKHYLALKNQIFIRTLRAFYKNPIFHYGTARANAFLAEKRRILGRKNGTSRA